MQGSKILLYFSLSFLGGVFLGSANFFSETILLGFSIFGLALISVFWRRKSFVVFGFCFIILSLGIWRYQAVYFEINSNDLIQQVNSKEKVTLRGRIYQEPIERENYFQLATRAEEISKNGKKEILGNVLVNVSNYPRYQYNDYLELSGILQVPPQIEDFNYKDYLAKDKIAALMYFPDIKVLETNRFQTPFSWLYDKSLRFKARLRENIHHRLRQQEAAVLSAMILGDKANLSKELKEKLNITGVRHIISVSGMHIVILSSVLMNLLLALGFWRRQACYISIFIMGLFILMTGLQPSGIRAGIMGGLLIAAQIFGRKYLSQRTLTTSAALMVAVNPLLLAKDIGFQLSFFATAGIVYLGPILRNWLKIIPQKYIREILIITLSAQIFTLPILVYNFGRMSFISLPANILIIPAVSWIMIFGFIFSFLAVFWQQLAWIFSLACQALLMYLLGLVNLLSHWRLEADFYNVHWFWLFLTYFILAAMTGYFKKKQRLQFLD